MKWTFKKKLAVILLSSILGILIITAAMLAYITETNKQQDKLTTLNEAIYTALDINANMESARKNDQAFILNPGDSIKNKIETTMKSITKNISKLDAYNVGMSKQTRTLKNDTTDYLTTFNNLSATKKVIGYTDKDGKLGAINKDTPAMKKIIDASGDEQLKNLMLNQELNQATFLKDPTEKHYETLINNLIQIDNISKHVLKGSTYNDYSNYSIDLLNNYQALNDFKNFESETLETFEKNAQAVEKTVTNTIDKLNAKKSALNHQQQTIQNVLLTSLIILGLLILVLLALFGGWLYRSVSSSLNALKEGASLIGDGYLNHRVPVKGQDEFSQLAHSFNQMAEKMAETVANVTQAADSLTTSSSHLTAVSEQTNAQAVEVNSAVQQVAVGAQNQAEHLEESMQLLANVSTAVEETQTMSDHITLQSAKAQEANTKGLNVVNVLEQGSAKFLDIAKTLIADIQSVAKQSEEITSIVNIIQDISKNTDLLALNAAIESARAGKAGQGFAVVSQEIRKLAIRSKNETATIQNVIQTITKQLHHVQQEAGKLNEYCNEQDHNVVQTKEAFANIDANVTSINGDISSIQTAIEHVSLANKNLSTKLEEISAISEETAASTEQVSASSESQTEAIKEVNTAATTLQEIALSLNEEVSKFKGTDEELEQDDPSALSHEANANADVDADTDIKAYEDREEAESPVPSTDNEEA
ncbi:hypothetical protein GCM10011391_37810 [Pullulanibacillus camelliae]|uniref:Methyl-accepting chemotaxis protein n=1 Tax=Pullulanibacillus camelliae TaxID=1707096 RepID=A0A8J2YNR9_9BACL|nr:methyl-accepting chemotaxis protein [Pullulanibacillus camelliae]GGE55220.1 hypothetical protein GCM10011391_37810 [Pullulanibacillus camelliae]